MCAAAEASAKQASLLRSLWDAVQLSNGESNPNLVRNLLFCWVFVYNSASKIAGCYFRTKRVSWHGHSFENRLAVNLLAGVRQVAPTVSGATVTDFSVGSRGLITNVPVFQRDM